MNRKCKHRWIHHDQTGTPTASSTAATGLEHLAALVATLSKGGQLKHETGVAKSEEKHEEYEDTVSSWVHFEVARHEKLSVGLFCSLLRSCEGLLIVAL